MKMKTLMPLAIMIIAHRYTKMPIRSI